MFGDYFESDTQAAVQALVDSPTPQAPVKRPGKWNGWSTILRGPVAAATETAAAVADSLKGFGQVMGAAGTDSAGGMFSVQSDSERRESETQRARIANDGLDVTSSVGTSLRDVADFYKPDPNTAGEAERIFFGVAKFIPKAVAHGVTMGPFAPLTLAVDDGMATSSELAAAGVDKATRTTVGMLAGAASGAGIALPVAVPGSIAKTVGLVLAGGPGAFVAQQAATREILDRADYHDLAQQYDPLDPLGLAVSTLVPAGFGAWAVRGARKASAPGARAAAAEPAAMPNEAGTPPRADALSPGDVDAVMTHNLTLAKDVHDATPPADFAARAERQAPFEPARNLTPEQRTVEQRFTDRVMEDVDHTLEQYARLPESHGGKVVNTDLFRELSPDYAASKEGRSKYAAAVHEPSSWLAREQYARLLDAPPEHGSVLILGGGGGSGKSTSLDVVSPGYANRYDAIYDTTLANQQRAIDAIEAALATGRKVEVSFTVRDPLEAIVRGVIPRAERDGRTVPLGVAAKAHEDAPRTLNSLIERYAEDDRVSFTLIDNTGAPGSQRVLTEMPTFDYNGLVERAYAAADKLYDQRQLSQATYDGLVAGRASEVDARRGEPQSRGPGAGREPPPEYSGGASPAAGRSEEGGVSRTGGSEAANDAAPTAADPTSPIDSATDPTVHRDPLTRSVLGRAADLEQTAPDMVVRTDENGRDITVREEMERIRKESLEGTESELGSQDAPLVEVAANCALSTGQA